MRFAKVAQDFDLKRRLNALVFKGALRIAGQFLRKEYLRFSFHIRQRNLIRAAAMMLLRPVAPRWPGNVVFATDFGKTNIG
ncbi:MAG: hypothetical protein D8M59_07720 [Planctomycetes bacterium]|nr:hypothetical protein [Planctomycetota bacterium]